jgi:hypothetical protein
MLFELRRYRCAPGRRDEWDLLMQETIIPFMTSKGMVVVAAFLEEDSPDVYMWIRRFRDEAHRIELRAAVYDSDQWKNDIAPRLDGLVIVEDIEVTRLTPTAASVIQ